MIFEAIISLILLIIISGFYFLYIKPSKRAERYVRDFERAGYKVYKFKFNPLDLPLFSIMLNDSKKGDPFKTYKQKFASYDILVGNQFNNAAISFISPAARKQFTKNEIDYAYIKLPLLSEFISLVIGKGLVFSEGEQWKRKRRIVSSLFNYQFLNKKVPEIAQICRSCLDQNELQSKTHKIQGLTFSKQQYQFHLIKLTSRIFSNIVLSLFLGTQSLQEKLDGKRLCHFIVDLMSEYTERINQPVPLILGPKYFKLGLTQIDRDLYRRKQIFNNWAIQYIEKIIQKINVSNNKNKNVNLLQLLYDSSKGKQNSYSKQELIDELKVFFFAGTDTTSHLVQMMIYYTANNECILKKVREEIDSFKGQICSIEDLKKLKYIEAIQKQTIRYYGPLPANFPRVTIKDHFINGVQISKGTAVQYHSATTHFDPKYYENPFQFNPDRWLNQNKQFDAACLTGFGMGSRSCIGQQLANIQSRIAFFYFFRRYKEIKVPKQILTRWKFMNEAQDLWVKTQKQ